MTQSPQDWHICNRRFFFEQHTGHEPFGMERVSPKLWGWGGRRMNGAGCAHAQSVNGINPLLRTREGMIRTKRLQVILRGSTSLPPFLFSIPHKDLPLSMISMFIGQLFRLFE